MTGNRRDEKRVLALDLASRGFGFVVLEGPDQLIDWGTRDVRKDKRTATLRAVRELIEFYKPQAIVIEDCTGTTCRRSKRIRLLLEDIRELAREMKALTQPVSQGKVRRVFTLAKTKHEIASVLVSRYPELTTLLPRKRKAWQSEDMRMRVFGALALAHLATRRGHS